MKSDTYEIKYRVKGEESPRPLGLSDEHVAMRINPPEHTMIFTVYKTQKETKAEINRVKAIARALCASDEFEGVTVIRKTEESESIDFNPPVNRPVDPPRPEGHRPVA